MAKTLDPRTVVDMARSRLVVRLPEEMIYKGFCLAVIPMTADLDCIRPDHSPSPDSLLTVDL